MSIQEILSREVKYQYMLLGRLLSDAKGWKTYLSGYKLWAGTPQEHAQYMIAIFQNLKIKPKWLTAVELQDICNKLGRKVGIEELTVLNVNG